MSIEKIDHELCNGCGICINSCSMDVITMDEEAEKAIIRYPEDCMMWRGNLSLTHKPKCYIVPKKRILIGKEVIEKVTLKKGILTYRKF